MQPGGRPQSGLRGRRERSVTGALISGRAATFDAAVARAAEILAASRLPLVAGLMADVATTRAAIRLAERLRGAFDHVGAAERLHDISALRETGMMLVSPTEARRRADLLVMIGPSVLDRWPEAIAFLGDGKAMIRQPDAPERRLLWLGAPGSGRPGAAGLETIEVDRDEIAGTLAALRARIAGRPSAAGLLEAAVLDRLAEAMKAARFGVAVWTAADLDPLAVEMLTGMIKDLNAATRWSGLPVGDGAHGAGIAVVSGWMTGLPPPLSFGRGRAEHDPWCFAAERLLASGEADALIWVATGAAAPAPPETNRPVILVTDGAATAAAAAVIPVGRAGVDHEALLFDPRLATFRAHPAAAPSGAVTAAEALARLTQALPC